MHAVKSFGPDGVFLNFTVKLLPSTIFKLLEIGKATLPTHFKRDRRIVTNCQEMFVVHGIGDVGHSTLIATGKKILGRMRKPLEKKVTSVFASLMGFTEKRPCYSLAAAYLSVAVFKETNKQKASWHW